MASMRVERVSEVIMNFVASELLELKDPRLELVTVTEVSLTPDLKRAHIYWSKLVSLDSEVKYPAKSEIDSIQVAFSKISKRLRAKAGRVLKLRYTPELIFKYDASQQNANRIDELLNNL